MFKLEELWRYNPQEVLMMQSALSRPDNIGCNDTVQSYQSHSRAAAIQRLIDAEADSQEAEEALADYQSFHGV